LVRFLLFFLALTAAAPAPAEVKIDQQPDRINVIIDGKPFTTLFMGKDAPKPYLHPLRSASGKIVTRHFPMEEVAGESHDHPHHRGLWFGHGDVNGFDFWANELTGDDRPIRGRIVLDKVEWVKNYPHAGAFRVVFNWLDPKGNKVLTERRTMEFYDTPGVRIIDTDIVVTAAAGPVTFGDTKEGTFAMRLADVLSEDKGGGLMTNAQGATTMKNVWGKPSEWVDYVGKIDGETIGIAIFDHPQNFRHPTTWHARDYGLFAANPFGEHDFYNDKSRNGSLTIPPGGTLRFRYRIVIHPGDTKSAGIDKLYSEYENLTKNPAENHP
jgi:hypothetical protein